MIVEFWIKSSRGTDIKSKVQLPDDYDEEAIKSELEQWCEKKAAWQVSDNLVKYGFKILNDGSKIEDPLIP